MKYMITVKVPSYSKKGGGSMKSIVLGRDLSIDDAKLKAEEFANRSLTFIGTSEKLEATWLSSFGRKYAIIKTSK